MRTNRFAYLLASVAMSACTLAPGYEQPALPVADQWPEMKQATPAPVEPVEQKAAQPATAAEAALPAAEPSVAPEAVAETPVTPARSIPWQQFFISPDMQSVITTALENNRDLKIATLNIESARALYRVSRADLLPSINADGAMTRQHTPQNARTSGAASVERYDAGLSIPAFELDLFGRIRSLNDAALEDYFATEEAKKAVEITLIGETANAYLQWLADKKILALTNDTLAAQERSFSLIEATNRYGIASALDLAQAQTSVETARANQAIYTRRVAQDENALMLLLGASDRALLPANASLDNVQLMDNLPVGLPSDILLARPDIKQAEHNLKAANANIGAARAAFFPSVTLTGNYGFASDSLSKLFAGGSHPAWSFMPQVSLPIFAGGRNLAGLDYADAQQKIYVANYERAIQIAFREVADELAARKTLDQQFAAQKRLVDASARAHTLSKARYDAGIDRYLNVLDAQRSLYTAQQGAIDTQRERLSNLVNLYKTVGGGTELPE